MKVLFWLEMNHNSRNDTYLKGKRKFVSIFQLLRNNPRLLCNNPRLLCNNPRFNSNPPGSFATLVSLQQPPALQYLTTGLLATLGYLLRNNPDSSATPLFHRNNTLLISNPGSSAKTTGSLATPSSSEKTSLALQRNDLRLVIY